MRDTSGSNIKVGDEIAFTPNDFRGGHRAYCTVTKVKRRTFDCVERKGSYRQGKNWNVHMESRFTFEFKDEQTGRHRSIGNSDYWDR
jgi:plastocyanin